jgi:hypothetical protein
MSFSSSFRFPRQFMTLILLQDKFRTLSLVKVWRPSILSMELDDKFNSKSSLNLSTPYAVRKRIGGCYHHGLEIN